MNQQERVVDAAYMARCLRKLKELNLPTEGWICEWIEDMEEPEQVCELCGCARVRFLHYIVCPKDILLNITGGSIGRCAIVPDGFDVANVNQHVMIIRLIDPKLRMWIHTVLISEYVQNMIMDVQVGVSREGLSATKLMGFLIPIPPAAEQNRIMQKILICTELL